MISQLGLIDYGMGNLHSVQQAFKRLKAPIKTVKTHTDLEGCKALVLPGVGAFDPAMENLKRTKPMLKSFRLIKALRMLSRGKLGISKQCLARGMKFSIVACF